MNQFGIFVVVLAVLGVAVGQDCANPPNNKLPHDCCNFPMPAENEYKQCVSEFGEQSKRQMENKIDHGCCVSECTFNATKTYLGNGKVDQAALVKILTSGFDPVWAPLIPQYLETCLKSAADKSAEFEKEFSEAPAFPGERICHPISGFIFACVLDNAFKNCPDAMFTKNAECDALKDFSQKCPISKVVHP